MLLKVLNICGKQKGLCTATAHEPWVKAKLNFWSLFCFSPYLILLNITHAKLSFFPLLFPSPQVHKVKKKKKIHSSSVTVLTILPAILRMKCGFLEWATEKVREEKYPNTICHHRDHQD